MGKRGIKTKKKEKAAEIIISSDEEDGNEDLSLKVVQKAALLQASSSKSHEDNPNKIDQKIHKKKHLNVTTTNNNVEVLHVKDGDNTYTGFVDESVVEVLHMRDESVAEVLHMKDEENADTSKADESGEKDSAEKSHENNNPNKINKKIKRKKHLNVTTTNNNVEVLHAKDGDNTDTSKVDESVFEVLHVKDEENADTSKADESAEKDPADKSDSLVLRKLLRGPRYFDPPDTGSGWGACYNCGEEGHTTANCTSARRRKPCFICGSLEHHVKECMKGQDCYICQKGGHHAKDCPENYKRASKIWKICLKCGDLDSHDMFSCKNEYFAEDLEGIQCYICRNFGHLCCADFAHSSLMELSCYRCGQLGHGGLDCGRLRSGKTIKASPGKCHACQESGHFAKNCPTSVKVEKRKYEFSTPTKKFTKEKVKIKKAKSVPSDIFKARKRKKAKMEEDRSPTPYSLRKRGGWITEDPIGGTQVRQWDSPMTPTYNKHKVLSPGGNGHNLSFDYTRYGSTMSSNRHGPSNQPYNQYGQDVSNEPYRHYRHAFSNESYDRFGHSPNAPYQEVPSRQPHHRYVVSPQDLPYFAYADTCSTGLSPSKIVSHTHHQYGRSPSHEAARAHHQSYPSNGSPKFFQQGYPTTRFQNSSSDGSQRFCQKNR